MEEFGDLLRYGEWESQNEGFKAQISNLRLCYHKLATKYRALASVLRRDVRLDNATSRFHCAALFQHLPPSFLYVGNGMDGGIVAEQDRSLAANEICPVSRKWYSELVSASEALAIWPNDFYSGSSPAAIQAHITRAENSLYHAEVLLDSINIQLPLTHQALAPAVLTRSWNRLCEGVKADLEGTGAVDAARKASAEVKFEMPKPPGTVFTRTWFTSEHILSNDSAPAAWLAEVEKGVSNSPKAPSSRTGAPPSAQTSSRPAASDTRSQSSAYFGMGAAGTAQTGAYPPPPHEYDPFRAHGQRPPPPSSTPLPGFSDPPDNPYWNPPSRNGYGSYNNAGHAGTGYAQRAPIGSHNSGYGWPFPDMSGANVPPAGANGLPPRPPAPPPTAPSNLPARPFASEIDRLAKYNSRWDGLEPRSSYSSIPYPSRTLNLPALDERGNHGLGQAAVMTWTSEDHIRINVSRFWAEGCSVNLRVSGSRKAVQIREENTKESVKALRKQLRMKEASRWHPDTLNRRTGSGDGGTDERIGKRKEMKAIWGALQDLLALCEKF